MSFPISLTKGLKYKFLSENNPSNETKLIMQIYMSSKKEMLIASTYNPSVDKHYPSMELLCHRSGTYYLDLSFDKAEKGCGVGFFAVSK